MSCLQGLLGNKHRRSKGEVFEKKSFCTLSCSNVELALLQGPHMHFDQAFSCSNFSAKVPLSINTKKMLDE